MTGSPTARVRRSGPARRASSSKVGAPCASMPVEEQCDAAEIRVDDVVLLAADKPKFLAGDPAVLKGRKVGVRRQPLFHRFQLLTDLGDERSSVRVTVVRDKHPKARVDAAR